MENIYIVDKVENLGKYAALGENFAKAVAFLQKADFAALPLGRNEVDGDNVWVNAAVAELAPLASKKPEVHRRYFDIQIPLDGEETYGLAKFDPAAAGSFDEAKDIGFYDQAVEPVTVRPGEFAILWPNVCAHAPGCSLDGARTIRKLVVKVKA